MNKQTLVLMTSAVLVIAALAVSYAVIAQAQSNLNASVSVKKQTDTGLFTFSIADSDGIEAFNFQPAKSSSYGGGLNCPKKFSNNNVQFIDPDDFDPAMKVSITDCKKNVSEFEIGPLKNGSGKGVLITQPQEETIPETKLPEAKTAPAEQASAPSKEAIQYPVKELGNCTNENACKSYCDKPDNYSACFAFAKKNGLLEEKLADKSEGDLEEFAQALKKGGPGGCQNQASCETYCNDTSRLNECLAFAEKHQLMKGKDLEEAKKIQAVLAGGGSLPGGCKNKKECDAYCGGPEHANECLAFAEKTGFMPPEEIAQARKAMELMAKGRTPGGCKSKEQCESYCEGGDHFEECIAFAEEAGFIPPEELAMIKKTGGKGPGGCKGKAQCENFCQDERNIEQCISFAEEHGLMKKEEIEMVRKTGGKGPGGCRGKNECEAFCQNPENQESCFNFAKEHNLLSAEDLKRIEEGQQGFRNAMDQAPPEVLDCLAELGIDENSPPRRGMEQQMEECFRSAFDGRGGPGGPGGGSGAGSFPGGPIRCGTEENPEECQQLEPPRRGGGGGPGGCTSPKECQAYCQEHPDECGGGQGLNQQHSEDQSKLQGQGQQHSEENSRLRDHDSIKSSAQFGHSEENSKLQEERLRLQAHDSTKSGAQFQHTEDKSKLQSQPQQYQQQYQQPPQEYQQYPSEQTPPPPTSYQLRGSLMAQVLGLLANLVGIR